MKKKKMAVMADAIQRLIRIEEAQNRMLAGIFDLLRLGLKSILRDYTSRVRLCDREAKNTKREKLLIFYNQTVQFTYYIF